MVSSPELLSRWDGELWQGFVFFSRNEPDAGKALIEPVRQPTTAGAPASRGKASHTPCSGGCSPPSRCSSSGGCLVWSTRTYDAVDRHEHSGRHRREGFTAAVPRDGMGRWCHAARCRGGHHRQVRGRRPNMDRKSRATSRISLCGLPRHGHRSGIPRAVVCLAHALGLHRRDHPVPVILRRASGHAGGSSAARQPNPQ